MAKPRPIERGAIVSALTLVLIFMSIMAGREMGSFYASYEELKSLKELFYEHFASTVDDLHDVTASGTGSNPECTIDNDMARARHAKEKAFEKIETPFLTFIQEIKT